jgi:hypothetical protein
VTFFALAFTGFTVTFFTTSVFLEVDLATAFFFIALVFLATGFEAASLAFSTDFDPALTGDLLLEAVLTGDLDFSFIVGV